MCVCVCVCIVSVCEIKVMTWEDFEEALVPLGIPIRSWIVRGSTLPESVGEYSNIHLSR